MAVIHAYNNIVRRLVGVQAYRKGLIPSLNTSPLQSLNTDDCPDSSSLEQDLLLRLDTVQRLQCGSTLEVVLKLEFDWMLFTEILQPILVGKLMLNSFPAFPDSCVIVFCLAHLAAARGLLEPGDLIPH